MTCAPPRRSPLPPLVALALLVGTPGLARADLGGATINFFKLLIHEGGGPLAQPSNATTATWRYFNLAHCVCAQAGQGAEQTFAYQLTLTGTTTVHKPLELWIGASCDDTVQRPLNCTQVPNTGISDIAALQVTPASPEISLFQLMNPRKDATSCTPQALSSAIWLLSDTTGSGTLDNLGTKSVDTDSQPPPLPTDFAAEGAEEGISLTWKAPLDNATDIYYYQALCAGPDGLPALAAPSEAPQYLTARSLCGLPTDPALTASAVSTASDGTVDAGTVTLPEGLAHLDPAYICGGNASATATSLKIQGLTNGTPYTVVLLAIDKWGNAAGTYFTSTLTPQPVIDFWEDLHGRGSRAEGGYCLLAETYGDGGPLTGALRAFRDDTLGRTAAGRWLARAYYAHVAGLGAWVHGSAVARVVAGALLLPAVALALAWHYLTLPGLLAALALAWWLRAARRRPWRRRAPALAAALVAALVATAPGAARADSQTPYWDDQVTADADASDEPDQVKWHVGLRAGAYIPAIDAQLGVTPGPYHQMFGGYRILPMLDVDRVVWRRVGQLTLGGSVGYMTNSAHAYAQGSRPSDPDRARAPGDETGFRVIPMALVAGYRFTWLDDEYGVPVVPYVRGGLAYYLWRMTAPDGNSSVVCADGSTTPGCERNVARGASAGLVGSIGLAIRGERVDPDSARAMRDSGLVHAGFYVEYQYAKVDGFGADTKLAVGDRGWFAGVDFEF